MDNGAISKFMLGLMFSAPTWLPLLAIIGMILFAFSKMLRCRRPAIYLTAGLVFILIGRLLNIVASLYLARTLTPDEFAFYNFILTIFRMLADVFGLGLMTRAVFVSRADRQPVDQGKLTDSPSQRMDSESDSNPYLPPSANKS